MFRLNSNGLEVRINFPLWFKKFWMKRQGLCAKEHSEFKGYYCVKQPNHDGWCGCA